MDTQIYRSSQRALRVGYKTDKGRRRSNNEDSYAVFKGAELDARLDALLVVADGMGGTKGGEIASNIVVNSLPEAIQNLHDLPKAQGGMTERGNEILPNGGEPFSGEIAALLGRAIKQANADVWKYKLQHPGLEQMGTTCVTAIVSRGVLTIGNVGDSRAYLLRRGQLSQITEDHSEVQEQVKAGRMTPEQAEKSRFRNTITRAMGLYEDVSPDILSRPLEDGDAVLLCSDGLTTEVNFSDIARLLSASADPQQACERLVEAALDHGGSDNVTVVVLHYGAFVSSEAAFRSAPPVGIAVEDDEDITDPNQAWKRSLGAECSTSERSPSGRFVSPMPEEFVATGAGRKSGDGETEQDRESVSARSARSFHDAEAAAPRRSGVSLLLFSLLLIAAFAEGVGLFLLWTGKIKPRPVPAVSKPAAARPTDRPLAYSKPALIYATEPLWEGALQVMPNGSLLVIARSGQELAVTPGGTATALSDLGIKLPILMPIPRGDGSLKPVPLYPAVAFDASGYRYELNPATKAIDKYDPAGARLVADIGKGALNSPANLAVDRTGSIYVIDSHHLKRIAAVPDVGQAVTPPRAITAPAQASTPPAPTGTPDAPVQKEGAGQ